jgi:hypothetical protein
VPKSPYQLRQILLWNTGHSNDEGWSTIVPWIGLFTSLPTGSSPGTEVSGGGYERISAQSFFPDSFPVFGETTNMAPLEFPAATDDWGTVVGYGLFDGDDPSDNLLRYALIEPQLEVVTGMEVLFASTRLTLREG